MSNPLSSVRRPASPLARAMARRAGLDLATLVGSGPGGRIVKADVAAAQSSPALAEPNAQAAFDEIVNPIGRRLLARLLTNSKRDAPHFYLRVDCELDALLELRAACQARASNEGLKLSIQDFAIRAAALALREVAAVNASYTEQAIRRYREVDIAFAVALEGGLLAPVIRQADLKSVAQISREARQLTAQARTGTLAPGACSGASFSISNLGGHGVREFAAVINPPQGAILALGAAEPRAVVHQGQLAIATVMTVTLSVDHRAIDGAVAAHWLASFKRQLQCPSETQVWHADLQAP